MLMLDISLLFLSRPFLTVIQISLLGIKSFRITKFLDKYLKKSFMIFIYTTLFLYLKVCLNPPL